MCQLEDAGSGCGSRSTRWRPTRGSARSEGEAPGCRLGPAMCCQWQCVRAQGLVLCSASALSLSTHAVQGLRACSSHR
eukprot:1662711-Rhodomonas_salina.1